MIRVPCSRQVGLHQHVIRLATWSCISQDTNRPRSFATTSARSAIVKPIKKPYYVTTPIFYVNAAPHVGHLYSMVLADIIKRWNQLKGRRVILCTGTDEHGMKIQRAAEAARTDTKAFCDKGSETFKNLATAADVSNDHFVRTTDPAHREAVQYAWSLLEERGYIYLSKHEGWYSVSDETFYPPSRVHLVVEPTTGRKIMASIETGKEVEWTSEENYRFRLSVFQGRLLDFYNENPSWIQPRTRRDDVVKAVSEGLEDLSVSRPAQRLNWGIPVPRDNSHTIYVWLDALINYVTKAGYPWTPDTEKAGGWPADLQVIGKDIIRFHCIYWPAFLMALELPLPKQILTHAHWTLGREKMSKSTGNVVNPFFAIDRFGVDVMRFYLAHDGGIKDDSAYSNESIVDRYKKDLQHSLGNLASRLIRGKGWNLSEAINQQAEYPKFEDDVVKEISFQTHIKTFRQCVEQYEASMDDNMVGEAVKTLMQLLYKTNSFLQMMEPWTLVKALKEGLNESDNETAKLDINRIVFHCTEVVRVAGILLQPVMPTKMNLLLDMLGVMQERRTFAYVQFGADTDYGTSLVPPGKGITQVLFPPLPYDE